MYFKMEIELDELWTQKLFELFGLKGSSNTPLSEVVEQALICGIAAQLRALKKRRPK